MYSYFIPIFNGYLFDCCTYVVPAQKTKGVRSCLTPLFSTVGVAGFEPATPCSQSRCANRTALHPENGMSVSVSAHKCANHLFIVASVHAKKHLGSLFVFIVKFLVHTGINLTQVENLLHEGDALKNISAAGCDEMLLVRIRHSARTLCKV